MLLNTLPDDLLIDIAKYVGLDSHFHADTRSLIPDSVSLCKLSLCSRRLNTIATPILYQTIMSTRQRRHAVPMLLKRILVSPEIGNQVKRYIGSNIRGIRLFDMSSYTEEDYVRVQLAIARFGNARKRWLRKVIAGHGDAVTALLFTILPNLEQLVMFSYQKGHRDYIEYVAKQASMNGPFECLTRLQTVLIAPPHDSGLDIKAMLPYLEVSSLRKMSIYGIVPECRGQKYRWSNPAGTKFRIRHLSLIHSIFNRYTLEDMLKDFPCLETFAYEYCGGPLGDRQQSAVTAIGHLKSSLEQLVLIDNCQSHDFYGQDDRSVRSLADFEKLTKISTNSYILVGLLPGQNRSRTLTTLTPSVHESRLVNMLPRSLKYLELYDCGRGILDHMKEVIEQKHESFPNLESILLTYRDQSPAYYGATEGCKTYLGLDQQAIEDLRVESRRVRVLLQTRLVDCWRPTDSKHMEWMEFKIMI